ncbi:MAG: hypothetical protein P9L99_04095 [Candidatus Lernaella stagnicola]|nr:hypothetical protein [Candidatus Lernaella stagnicola]
MPRKKQISVARLKVISSQHWFSLIVFICLPAMLILASCADSADNNNDDGIADDDSALVDDDDSAPVDDDATDDDTFADDDDDSPPVVYPALLPGPGEPGYDAELEAKARMYDRSHLVFNCAGHGINADVSVNLEDEEDRLLIEEFIQETDGWDFEAFSGKTVDEVVDTFHKVAGLYGGVGIAADAYRYGVMRDQGYTEDEVDLARGFLQRDIETMFIAFEITGIPGIIPRGICKIDTPGYCADLETTPLFDEFGDPLPEEKNNGTWREDNTPDNRYPGYKWEDSCSRDMYLGWANAVGAVWEVIQDDPTFAQEDKDKLQQFAGDMGRELMKLRPAPPWGEFDLEIYDADGRTTYHGYLNENAYDRVYLPFIPLKDGLFATMAVGIVSALTYVSEDPVLVDYLYDHLLGERGLDRVIQNHQLGLNLWWQTNFSGSNMAFEGALMAARYVATSEARDRIRWSIKVHMYENGLLLLSRQPEEYAYSLFDFVYAAAIGGSSAYAPALEPADYDAVARGVQTLREFPDPPFWDYEVVNCDEDELAAHLCELNDGTIVHPLGEVGRKGTLICQEPIPQRVRPPSNYRWRSDPYTPNGGGDGSGMLPGVDFRWAYWYARWVK